MQLYVLRLTTPASERKLTHSLCVNSDPHTHHMSKGDKRISHGLLKGKTVTFAPTARIEDFTDLANEFMEEIFDLMPGEYIISDESDLRDFMEMGSSDTSELWKRIEMIYGIEAPDIHSGRFVDIFTEIARRRNTQ
jgi:hypothetical protein